MDEKLPQAKKTGFNWRLLGQKTLAGIGMVFAAVGFGIKSVFNTIRSVGGAVMGRLGTLFNIAVLGSAAALIGPGLYHKYDDSMEYVTAKVTGKVQADSSGQKYFIYTDGSAKLDTFSVSNGGVLQENMCYRFNLRGAHIQAWPPSYSRNIVDAIPMNCPTGGILKK